VFDCQVAGLEEECGIAGVMPELFESETCGLAEGLGSMPKDMTYWMRENPPSVGTQCHVRLEVKSCNKYVGLTGIRICDTGMV
jgi:hypothetical protein